jgi:predicted RNase H-like nuclease (RuvC/YqgF family)
MNISGASLIFGGVVITVVTAFIATIMTFIFKLKIEQEKNKKLKEKNDEILSLLNECRKDLKALEEKNSTQKEEILRLKSVDEHYSDKIFAIKDSLVALKERLEEQDKKLKNLELEKLKFQKELQESYKEIFQLKQQQLKKD